MQRWITMAPNGKSVKIQVDNFVDREFLHRQVIDDKEIAERYNYIFKPYIMASPLKEDRQILTEVPEVKEPKKQILTEVPEIEEVEPEIDKPKYPTQEAALVEDEVDYKIDFEMMTKKELQELVEKRGISVSKWANKNELIEALDSVEVVG